MSFLRLGVACAVSDGAGRILLSKRGDLDVWNLPTGRLDRGEPLPDAALREVAEETGIEAEITRIAGLYYYQGWQRMNILFDARKRGGMLQRRSFETRDNRFFAPKDLPANNISQQMVDDVLNDIQAPMHVITMPVDELRRTRLMLRWRWIKNLLQGHVEPRYPRFMVRACRAPCDLDRNCLAVDGKRPLWEQLNLTADRTLKAITQDVRLDKLTFCFGRDDTGMIHFNLEGE